MTALAEPYTITGSTFGVVVARDLRGNQVASAYNGRDGWAVTSVRGRCVHQICVESEADAMTMLAIVAREVTSC